MENFLPKRLNLLKNIFWYNDSSIENKGGFLMKDFINWDAEKGIATCTLIAPDGITITKTAQCAEEDRDMMSEKTGCTIAQMRATIALSKHIRDYIIKPELYTLKNFYII